MSNSTSARTEASPPMEIPMSMFIHVIADISVCKCCLMVIANADSSGCEEGCDASHAGEVRAGIERECAGGVRLVAGPSDDRRDGEGVGIDDDGFSWSACEVCGDSLGGQRYAAHLTRKATPSEANAQAAAQARLAHSVKLAEECANDYTSIGSYPLFAVAAHDTVLCPACVRSHMPEITGGDGEKHGEWTIWGVDANWENPTLHCDVCEERIPSAYAEDDDDGEDDADDGEVQS